MLKGDNDVPQRSLAEADRCSLRFRLVTSNSHHLSSNPDKESHPHSSMYPNEVLSAWTEVWGTPGCSKVPIVAPEGRSGQIFEVFEILGGASDTHNSTSMPNCQDGPYGDLGVYVNEIISAWTEVWATS